MVIEFLETRVMLATPVIAGWWSGLWHNSLADDGAVMVRFKQVGSKLSGRAVDSDGEVYSIAGSIGSAGIIKLTMKGDDGTAAVTGKIISGRISMSFQANSGVTGKFSLRRITA